MGLFIFSSAIKIGLLAAAVTYLGLPIWAAVLIFCVLPIQYESSPF